VNRFEQSSSFSRVASAPLSAGAVGGFADYNDTTGTVALSSDTWATVQNNGLGTFTNRDYLPAGVTELLDVSSGALDFSDLALGDAVLIRNDFTVTPNTNNALLKLRYQLGSGGSAYTLEKIVGRLDSGSGIGYRFSLQTDFIYMGDLNTQANPVSLQLNLSANGSFVNAGSVIQVIKYA
tara:strand:+ start:8162 stop:8701 length:540 start_codon:yes stop_codon:yes gene_type:complete